MSERLHHVIDSDGCITCPFCLHERWDDLHFDDGDHEETCEACERVFVVRVETTRNFTSLVAPTDLEGSETR